MRAWSLFNFPSATFEAFRNPKHPYDWPSISSNHNSCPAFA
jgi:hypothetical protein